MNFNSILEELDKLYEDTVVSKETNKLCSVVFDGEQQMFTGTKDECEKWIKAKKGPNASRFSIKDSAAVNVVEEGCAKEALEETDEEDVAEEPVEENLGTALAVGADALAGTAIGNLISESADDEEEIEFAEEPVATIEGEGAAVEETRQLILECSKCGAVVIKDEADVVIDEESDLVNVEEECQYCEETEGYKIIGVVAPYEAVAEEPVEEETIEEEEELDELFNVNANVDLRDFGGTGNDVSVLSSPLESLDAKKLAEEDDDLDELFNTNIKLDARGFGGKDNKVDVL